MEGHSAPLTALRLISSPRSSTRYPLGGGSRLSNSGARERWPSLDRAEIVDVCHRLGRGRRRLDALRLLVLIDAWRLALVITEVLFLRANDCDINAYGLWRVTFVVLLFGLALALATALVLHARRAEVDRPNWFQAAGAFAGVVILVWVVDGAALSLAYAASRCPIPPIVRRDSYGFADVLGAASRCSEGFGPRSDDGVGRQEAWNSSYWEARIRPPNWGCEPRSHAGVKRARVPI